MKERLVKGTSLVQIVRSVRAHRRERALPDFGDWERDLLQRRISPSTWYSLRVYESLLQTVHRYVLDGSEAAAQQAGRSFGQSLLGAGELRMIADGPPVESLGRLASQWRRHFNFGELRVTPWPNPGSDDGVCICVSGFPDMSAALGHAIIGVSQQLAASSGAQQVDTAIEERPWMHHSVLRFTLSWS